jgi:hypothetical protein
MTITMPDSIKPASLPAGYPAYLGYEDGEWPTAAGLRTAHPEAHVVGLTVLGGTLEAAGVDCEPGNVNAVGAAGWVKRKLASAPASRPVAYADLESPGYSMAEVIAALLNLGIPRVKYRVLTAHYTGTAHICSPSTCGTAFQADGTQWTSKYPGIGGADIDMSLLDDSFFGAAAPAEPTWQETAMQNLPLDVKQGASGEVVRTIQSLCIARHQGALLGVSGDRHDGVDGVFGAATTAAVKAVQKAAGFTGAQQDGAVGPLTWPKLFGV